MKQRLKAGYPGQRGIGLVETLMAVAVLGTAVVAFATALSAGSIAVGEHDRQALAQGLAQSQMEYTQSSAFSPGGAYPLIDTPEDYGISVCAGAVPGGDASIQKITVTVSRDGEDMITLEDYKVDR